MEAKIKNINEQNGILNFTIENVNFSFANALRRTITSDIPTVVIKTEPYEENITTIHKNTSGLNNEILKHRLQCIPIHIKYIDNESLNLENYQLELNIENETSHIVEVTTKDFKIKNIETDKYLSESDTRKIFPPDPITNDFIVFTRLGPLLSAKNKPETIHLTSKFTIATGAINGCFKSESLCSYKFTEDLEQQKIVWETEKEKYDSSVDLDFEKKNWKCIDAKRIFIENSFDFTLETIGVYSNRELVKIALNIIKNKINEIMENEINIEKSLTIMDAYDIKLMNEDYTIGKLLEFFLGTNISFDYIGFQKFHPHDNYSILRLSYNTEIISVSEINKEKYIDDFKQSCQDVIDMINNIIPVFD
jgi:DNA-directed RNA polymerase subunit L